MSTLKDVASIVNDAAKIWGDLFRFRFENQTKSLKRCMIRFIVEVMLITLAFVFIGIGAGLIITACRVYLVEALGNPGGTLILGIMVTGAALLVAWAAVSFSRKT
jgi:hypothetical protein